MINTDHVVGQQYIGFTYVHLLKALWMMQVTVEVPTWENLPDISYRLVYNAYLISSPMIVRV